MIITRWAIRRKSDGYYIPQPQGRNGRGGSFVEPINPVTDWQNVRLFHKESAAKIALNAWLQGHWVASRGESYDHWSGATEYYEETDIVAQPHRRAEDMEIVSVEVHLPGEAKVKPQYKLTGAVFIRDSLFGTVHEGHPNYDPTNMKATKVSRILNRDGQFFETANSVYEVTFVPDGESTIPKEWK